MITRSNRELWLAFIAIASISLLYIFTVAMLGGVPPAREFFGHSIGILGFVLMLMTESLYSLRKRSRRAQWGRMSAWLDFHIFTGLVGPFMVLLHSSWKFNGLAGIVMLLTAVIVLSGFIGRYIYTAVPRTADGVELEAGLLESQIAQVDADLQRLLADGPARTRTILERAAAPAQASGGTFAAIFGRALSDLRFRSEWGRARRELDTNTLNRIDQLEGLVRRKRSLYRQVSSLAAARRLLALWHAVHIPIGMVLFTAAFIHALAAIYYATLLR